jgi:glycogen synthase
MKLLVYSHSFAPNVGGIETIVSSLARGLAEDRGGDDRGRFELTLATQTPAGDFDDAAVPFCVVRRPGIGKLWRLIRTADVVHVAGPALAPLLLAWFARKPFIIEHHGYQAICPNGLLLHEPDKTICPGHFQAGHYGKCRRCQAAELPWWRSLVNVLAMFPRHFLARRAAQNIAISHHQQQRLGLPSSRLVYHGVEDVPDGEISAQDLSTKPGTVCFAYVGRLVAEKGLPALLRAAAMVNREGHEFELLLIGDGPQRQKLEAMIEQSGLHGAAQCTGFLQGAAFAETMRRVHVVVMPSAWEETAGLAAIEQMMRGKVVIASRIGGLSEMVGDTALTCEPGSAEELAQRMKEVLQDFGKARALGLAARQRTRKLFLRGRMVAEHARLYGDVLHAIRDASKRDI